MVEKNEKKLHAFMMECGINTMEQGQALWKILANRDIEVNGVPLENGSWRRNGGTISEICGGDYMDYYCNRCEFELVVKTWKTMKEHGAIDRTEYNGEDSNGFWYDIGDGDGEGIDEI